MPNYDYECPACGVFEAFRAPGDTLIVHDCGREATRVWRTFPGVVDDTLPGGPRWMHNLDDHPVWVETKTQLGHELSSRGLRLRDGGRHNTDDKSPWATRTRLRPEARDPAIQRADGAFVEPPPR